MDAFADAARRDIIPPKLASVMRPSAAVLVLLCLALAGCSEGTKAPPGDDGPPVREVEPGPDTGAISGIVVDETITPVVGAAVALTQTGATAEVDGNGLFVFEDLEPGLYSLEASAPGHATIQSTVDVRAGEVAKPKMVLPVDASPQPYHRTHQHHGFTEAYLGFASFAVDTVQPGLQGCDCSMVVTPDPDAATFVFEAFGEVWMDDPGTPYDSVYYEISNNDGYDASDPLLEGFIIHSAHARFPVHDAVSRDTWPEAAMSWTVRLTGGMWVHPQLEYDMFLTVFYREPAPDGWSIAA